MSTSRTKFYIRLRSIKVNQHHSGRKWITWAYVNNSKFIGGTSKMVDPINGVFTFNLSAVEVDRHSDVGLFIDHLKVSDIGERGWEKKFIMHVLEDKDSRDGNTAEVIYDFQISRIEKGEAKIVLKKLY